MSRPSDDDLRRLLRLSERHLAALIHGGPPLSRDERSEWRVLHDEIGIDNVAEELLELREKTRWRPIETAPKDGSMLIAWCQYMDVAQARFSQRRQQWLFSDYGDESDWKPTHWMPMPSPPEQEGPKS
jgi:Protein of unknown function (DUF551)